jgi:DNA-binding IclR family transcriptional regulator
MLGPVTKYLSRFMDEISASENGVSTSEVAAAIGVSRPTANRMLQTLVASGIVLRDPETRRFFLTPRIYAWATQAIRPYLPNQMIRQEIAHFSSRMHRAITYIILNGSDIMALERTDIVAGQVMVLPDGRTPDWWRGSGKSIVAFLPHSEREAMLSSIADEEARALLRSELDEINRLGYQEYQGATGGHGVAAPVFDASGHAVAAVVLVSSTAGHQEPANREARDALVALAGRCSVHMGYADRMLVL